MQILSLPFYALALAVHYLFKSFISFEGHSQATAAMNTSCSNPAWGDFLTFSTEYSYVYLLLKT